MPDKDGKLSDIEREKAKTWLAARQAMKPCPVCGFNEWTIGDLLLNVPLFPSNLGIVQGGGFPTLAVYCNRCSFTRMHSSIMIGLTPADPEEDAAKKEATHG